MNEFLDKALRHHRVGQLAQAEALYRQILLSQPNHPDALHMLGVIAHQAGQYDIAIQLISHALKINNTDSAYSLNLGFAYQVLNKPDEAIAYYQQAIVIDPDLARAYFNLGFVLATQGKLGEAVVVYKKVLDLQPNVFEAYIDLGNIFVSQGNLAEASVWYRQAVAIKSDNADPHICLGNLLKELKHFDEAETVYRKALRIKPDYAGVHNNLGIMFHNLKRFDESEAAYRNALCCKPDYADAYSNLGNLLKELKRFNEAETFYLGALRIRPDYADVYSYLAAVYIDTGRSKEATIALDLCLRIAPLHAKAYLYQLLNCLPTVPANGAEVEYAVAKFDALFPDWAEKVTQSEMREAAADAVGDRQPFYLAYRSGNQRERLSRFGNITTRLMAERWPVPLPRRTPGPVNRVKLAIISGHVRRHSVWDIVLHGLLAYLDRDYFEVILIHTSHQEDAVTAQAESLVAKYHGRCGDLEACLQILKQAAPEVIFYPEIGMDPMTNKLANLRLAPLQVVSWGHPITTGLPMIDLYLSGEQIEPPNADEHYREKLIRLPSTGACTLSPTIKAEPFDPKIGEMLSKVSGPRFILCQGAFKFDPMDDGLFPRIATGVGQCRFFLLISEEFGSLFPQRLVERLQTTFVAAGLNPHDYLQVVPWLPAGQFHSFLDEMDVYLDCPGFSGYTTAWRAVHRGVPIVTLEGNFMRQRLAAGVLRQMGHTDTIAHTRDEYVEIAVRLALESCDRLKREARGAAIRATAPLLDNNVAVVRAFEQIVINELGACAFVLKQDYQQAKPVIN